MPTQHSVTTLASESKTSSKRFSLDEANQSLTYVSRVVRDLMACYSDVVAVRNRIEDPSSDESTEHLEAEYEGAMDRLGVHVEELHRVGVELKDFERGLLDFPASFEGRDIFLCWQFGEAEIHAWHEADSGYSGRQDVALLAGKV